MRFLSKPRATRSNHLEILPVGGGGGLDSSRQPRGEQKNPGWVWVLVGLFQHGLSSFLLDGDGT